MAEIVEHQLAGFKRGLERGLRGSAVVKSLNAGGGLLLFPGADCSLTFWKDASHRRVLVRWRITLREAPPGLGTWWADGEAFGVAGASLSLGRWVGRTVAEEVLSHSANLMSRSCGPAD